MKRTFYILIILVFTISCTSRTIYKKPENLIEKEKMINILTDVYLARAGKTIKTINQKKNINFLPVVYKKHNIDSAQFSESNIYYISRIDEYEKMFKEVENRLKDLKKEYTINNDIDSVSLVPEEEIDLEKVVE